MNCNLPGSSVYGILQARMLEWGASSSLGDLPAPVTELASLFVVPLAGRFFTTEPRQKWVFQIAGRFSTIWDTREAPKLLTLLLKDGP